MDMVSGVVLQRMDMMAAWMAMDACLLNDLSRLGSLSILTSEK